MEQFYDDSLVTLRDGTVQVDGVKVAGSITFRRDPRLSHLAQALADLPPIWKAPRQMAQVDRDSKWCSTCGDVRPRSYFSPDKRTFDGLHHSCKGCRATHERAMYAQAVGREVRPYARREKVTA